MGWLFDVLGISVDGFVSSIFNGIINWIYEVIFSVIKVVFTKINETGSDLFRLPWVQSLVNFFYILGWALFAIGLVVSISDMVIEYSNGKGDVKTTAINWLKAVLAVSLFTILPERLYNFAVYTQDSVSRSIIDQVTDENYYHHLVEFNVNFVNVIFILMILYATVKVFFANVKRGGILLTLIGVGSLYMLNLPRGYSDGFNGWIKQVIALCFTSFMQTTLFFTGLITIQSDFKEETKEMIQTLVRKGLPYYNYIVTEKTIDNKNYKTQVLTVKSGENTDTVKYTVSGAGDIYLPLFIAMYHAKNGVYVKDMLKNSVSDLTSDIAENTESSGIADYNDFIATVRLANIDLFGAAEIGRAVTNAISNGAISITHKITSDENNRKLTLTLVMPSQKEWEEMFGVSEKEDIVTDNLKVIETMLEKAGITDLYFPVATTMKSALFTYFEGFFNLPVNSSELENRVILTSLNAEQFFHHNGLYTAYDGGVTLSLKASEIPVRIDILPSADEVIQDAFIYDVYNSEEHNIIKSTPNYTYNCSAVEIAYIIDVDAFKEQYGFEFPTIVMTNGNTFKAGDTITMLVEYSCMERIAIGEEDIGHSLRDIFGNSQMIIGYSHSGTHSKEKDEGFDSTGWYHTFGSEKNVYHLGIKAAFVDGEVVRQEYQKPHTYNGLSVKNTGAKVNPLLWFKAFRTAA